MSIIFQNSILCFDSRCVCYIKVNHWLWEQSDMYAIQMLTADHGNNQLVIGDWNKEVKYLWWLFVFSIDILDLHSYRPISQILQCIRQMSHNAPFCNRNVHTCAHFCYKVVHCGMYDWCIVGFVQQAYYLIVPIRRVWWDSLGNFSSSWSSISHPNIGLSCPQYKQISILYWDLAICLAIQLLISVIWWGYNIHCITFHLSRLLSLFFLVDILLQPVYWISLLKWH